MKNNTNLEKTKAADVEFKHIDKIFEDGTHAVTDLSLKIHAGEFVVFVGPSGCGKSTLLRLIAGLETSTAGEVCLNGQKVNDWSPQRRNIAMVFQNYALYPHMTVQQNLMFPLRMLKLPKQEISRRVTQTADMLQLGELLKRKPGQLSGGQRQRVAMGRALVRQPQVFLMDEPLSNLDAKLRVQLRTDIATLQKQLGTTTIYVTHDQVEAMTLGDRVAVLLDGRLQQLDTPQGLYTHPENMFVAGFLGNPGMNVFPVRVVNHTGSTSSTLRIGAQTLSVPLNGLTGQCPEADETLFMGMRPEALTPVPADHDNKLSVIVETTEMLGHEQLVYCQMPVLEGAGTSISQLPVSNPRAAQLIVRLPVDNTIQPGDELHLTFAADQLYWFGQDGVSLSKKNHET